MNADKKPDGAVLAEQIERGEVNFLDILRTRGELCVMVPGNSPEAARAMLDRLSGEIRGTEFEQPMQPILDNIRFDIEAAERGAFPPGFA